MNSPVSPRTLRYAIIGAGMSGILAAKRLLERGERAVTVFEKADKVGGQYTVTELEIAR